MINKEKIETLNTLQQDYENVKNSLKVKEEEFKESNNLLFDTIEKLSQSIEEVKEELKYQGIEEFKETGVKKLTGGLSIRELNNVSYDEETALKWALNHSMALKLDTSKFKKIAKIQELDFVTFEKKPIVCFPTKK